MDIRLMTTRLAEPPARIRVLNLIPAILAGAVLATAVDWAATSQGWWWMVPLASAILGAAVGRWRALLAAAAAAVAAWGGILILVATEGSVPRIAQVAGGLAGLGNHAGPLVIALTVAYSALLGAAGGWLGVAARRLVRPVALPAAAAAAEPAAQAAPTEPHVVTTARQVTSSVPAEPAAEVFRG
jgi:hypothetical protein